MSDAPNLAMPMNFKVPNITLPPLQVFEDIERLRKNMEAITKPFVEFQKRAMANFPDIRKFAPGIEQLAAIEGISKAGFVAHSILAKHYDREFFEETSSDDLASRLWQEVRLELKLPLERCLGDQRIFENFD